MELPTRSFETEEEEEVPFFPSQRLLSAILLRAVRDFVTYRNAKEGTEQYKIAQDAAGWVFWEGKEALTFRDICSQIDVDPVRMRNTMLRLRAVDLLRLTPPSEE